LDCVKSKWIQIRWPLKWRWVITRLFISCSRFWAFH
jgi:hypothetical protein